MERSPQYPKISQAIVLLILVLVFGAVFSVLAGLVGLAIRVPIEKHPAVLGLVNLIAFAIVLTFGQVLSRAPLRELFPLKSIPKLLFVPLSLTVIGGHILTSEMDNLVRLVIPVPQWLAELLKGILGGETSLWGTIWLLVIVAPLTEEFLFRGLILRGFLSRYSVRKAILVSALLFGAFHLNPWQFVGATPLGIIFAWWVVETRSLIPCLFGHALNNALPALLTAVLHLQITGYTTDPSATPEFQPLWLDAVGVVLLAAGIWLFKRFSKGSQQTIAEPEQARVG